MQHTILTVRGRGYQIVAPVQEVPDAPAGGPATATAEAPTLVLPAAPVAHAVPAAVGAASAASPVVAAGPAAPATAAARPRRRLLPAIALLLLVAGALLGWRTLRPAPGTPAQRPYVLVLPFDVAAGAASEWGPYAEQATREVIGHPRKISGLRVVPTTSPIFDTCPDKPPLNQPLATLLQM